MTRRLRTPALARVAMVLLLAVGPPCVASPPPLLPPCPVPPGVGDRLFTTESGFYHRYIREGSCYPQWSVDLYRPAYDPGAPDPIRFTEAPFVDAAVVIAEPAAIEYGDGADRTITLTFDALHTFRSPESPGPLGEAKDYVPSQYWEPGFSRSIPLYDWARRTRSAAGVFGEWERLQPRQALFTLTPNEICGGTRTGRVAPPIVCRFTLHWNAPVTQDVQVALPVRWDAYDVETFGQATSYIGAAGFTWLALSIGAASELSASLVTAPSEVTVGEQFRLTLAVENPLGEPISDVGLASPLVVLGEGEATQLSGPEPASIASLAPGAKGTLSWTFETKKAGAVVIRATAQARTASGALITAEAKCGLGRASLAARATEAEPSCPVGGGVQVEVVPCKLALHDYSEGLRLPRLGEDKLPPPGSHDYPPGST